MGDIGMMDIMNYEGYSQYAVSLFKLGTYGKG